MRKRITPKDLLRLAEKTIERLNPFEPDLVVYVAEGGALFGRQLAELYGVPALGLDISYPLSRPLAGLPRCVRNALWPFKEIGYRLSRPHRHRAPKKIPPGVSRVVLADDSASSGRTVRLALELLAAQDLPKDEIRVAVIRCGRNAREIVDCALFESPVLFDWR